MPTHRNVRWEPVEPPRGLRGDQGVFSMRTTGEIFLTYGEYIARLEWYLDKNWICNRTSRSGLTFEQALESEGAADKMLSYFPPHLYEIVLKMVQGNKLNLDQLIQHIYILLKSKSKAKQFISSYKVTFCKDVIRQFIRDNTYKRSSIPGSGHIVKWEIADKFKLKQLERYVPKKLRADTTSNDTQEQRREIQKIQKTPFTFSIKKLHRILSGFHNCTSNPEENKPLLKIFDEFHQDINFPNLIIKCCDCDFSHTLKGVKRMESCHYPKPDEDLAPWERATETLRPSGTSDPVFSECKGDLLFAWHFLYTMHEFIELSTFPFRELEDALIWEQDNPNESPSALLSETFTALARCVIHYVSGRLFSIVRYIVGGYKAVSRSNWEESVRGYVISCVQLLEEIMARGRDEVLPFEVPYVLRLFVSSDASLMEASYKRLSITTKAKLLMFLCEHIGMLGKFREFLDQFSVQLHEARSKLWEERSKMLLDTRSEEVVNGDSADTHLIGKQVESVSVNGKSDEIDRNIKRWMTQVKSLQQKLKSFCVEPLGLDRDYNLYWYLPTIGYRVYVEVGDEWRYLDSKDDIEHLIGYLNEKGERESILKDRLIKLKEEIFSSIDSYLESFTFCTEVRRSTRTSSILKQKQSFVNYFL